jgi:hypothetical protein
LNAWADPNRLWAVASAHPLAPALSSSETFNVLLGEKLDGSGLEDVKKWEQEVRVI